ncbi:TPA: glycosyltransferase [Enterobacter hormaechei]|uniref:glycosyltransferase n=1 Tax=Enterobacter cloacae complex TaxID=354276 RepID=UPI001875F00A|nr:glycosyltransferase [Enterobacter cloacae complex sp. P18RS]MBE4987694.1 glycosyltransferase [Enterobacter cloacae complex sp. P18RS]HAV1869203.1 glycosyltransferase [Enterobacter hormaechei subsp. steigerwaltii]HAV1873377.1 glycosyltransferase [Enterobacter hormaechei subsp. steigerwaltii]
MHYRGQHVALIVPCYNEESAIESVVYGFREALPEIDIYVFDNNSSDRTAQVAEAAGAKVIAVKLPGKGNVVRRMFADVEADIYVMVDGDATYEAGAVKSLVDKLLDNHLDMVVGCRKTREEITGEAYRRGHQWGNYMLTNSVVKIFGGNFTDMLSGYRAFTRRYVKSFPAISRGFEIETELTVHALELRMPYGEVMTEYGARPEGSVSKLSTYRDGFRILKMIARLYITERPFAFFGICALLMALTSVILGFPLLTEYLETGLVPRFPTAILAASIMIASALSFVCGLILDNVTRGRHEMKRLVYLGIPLPSMGSNK